VLLCGAAAKRQLSGGEAQWQQDNTGHTKMFNNWVATT